MTQLVDMAEYRRNSPRVFFDRVELLPILGVYSRQVSRGVWRDYTIDHRSNMAIFSIFRRAREQPLYTITKVLLRGNPNPKFVLASRNGQIGSSGSLGEIVDILSRQLAVVN
jgi:hypothetical protein